MDSSTKDAIRDLEASELDLAEETPTYYKTSPYHHDNDQRITIEEGFHYHAANADDSTLNQPGTDGSGKEFVEILLPDNAAKLIMSAPPAAGYCARLRVYIATQTKQAVVERDDHILTPDEQYKHAKEMAAAIKEELLVWVKHHCFRRRRRYTARNILDVRLVTKWKKVKAATGSDMVWIIRVRMTLRGFKDLDAGWMDTFAGTSSRLGQRLVASEAAIQGWPMVALDVKKAFLKGITYAQLAEITGEP